MNDNQIDILERELRTQEDYIYELEDYVAEYSEKLRQCRCAHPQETNIYSKFDSSKPDLAEERPKGNSRSRSQQKENSEDDDLLLPNDFEVSEPEIREILPEEIDIPEDLGLDIGSPVSRFNREDGLKPVAPVAFQQSKGTRVGGVLIPDPAHFQNEEEVATFSHEQGVESVDETVNSVDEQELPILDRTPQELVISHVLRDTLGKESPLSLLTVVEARDAQDEPVDLEGEISLMVMAGNKDKPKRLKRWDFTQEEAAAAWQTSQFGDGLHLELPMEGTQLTEPNLELWVRLVGPNGTKLLSQVQFDPAELLAIDSTEAYGELQHSNEAWTTSPEILAERGPQKLSGSPAGLPETQPRWRASMERSDSPARGFSTTDDSKGSWTSQPPGGRLLVRPPAVAVRRSGKTGRPTSANPEDQSVLPAGHSDWVPYR